MTQKTKAEFMQLGMPLSYKSALLALLITLAGCASVSILPIIPIGEKHISFYGVSETRQVFELKVINGRNGESISLALGRSDEFCKRNALERWVVDKDDYRDAFTLKFACIPSRDQIQKAKQREALNDEKNELIKLERKISLCEESGFKRGTQRNSACVEDLNRMELKEVLETIDVLNRLKK